MELSSILIQIPAIGIELEFILKGIEIEWNWNLRKKWMNWNVIDFKLIEIELELEF